MNFYIEGTRWIRCEIVRRLLGGIVIFRLYNETQDRHGRARPGLYGLLVEAK